MINKNYINFVSGGLASITAEICTLPMDTVKIHLQTRSKASLIPAIKKDGLKFLYRGLVPGVWRQGIYSSIKMGAYDHVKTFVNNNISVNASMPTRILSGGISGVLGSAFTNPFDILKIRRQAQRNMTAPNHLFRDLYNLGLKGLHQGLSVNLQRSFVVNSAELATYDTCKTYLIDKNYKDNIFTHFASSCVAGFFAAGAAAPIDFAKTRLMNDTQSQYSGIVDCFRQTCKTEGFKKLYSGFIPAWLRIGPWCCIMFVTWEQYKNWMGDV